MTNPKKPSQPRVLLIVTAVVLMALILVNIIQSNQEIITDLKYSEFKAAIETPSKKPIELLRLPFQKTT